MEGIGTRAWAAPWTRLARGETGKAPPADPRSAGGARTMVLTSPWCRRRYRRQPYHAVAAFAVQYGTWTEIAPRAHQHRRDGGAGRRRIARRGKSSPRSSRSLILAFPNGRSWRPESRQSRPLGTGWGSMLSSWVSCGGRAGGRCLLSTMAPVAGYRLQPSAHLLPPSFHPECPALTYGESWEVSCGRPLEGSREARGVSA